MKRSFVLALAVCCTLQLSAATNPAQKLFAALSVDLKLMVFDIVHVLDSSYSVGATGFEYGKSAAKVTNYFYNGIVSFVPSGTRAALVKFSTEADTKIVFHLTDYTTLDEHNDAIDDTVYDWGAQTAIGVALKKARDELNNHSSAARKKKVWLLTDGNNNVPTVDPVTEADALKAMGAQLCVVGIGSNINVAALNSMASMLPDDPVDKPCVFLFDDSFEYYLALLEALAMLKQARNKQVRTLIAQSKKVKKMTRRKVAKAQVVDKKRAKIVA